MYYRMNICSEVFAAVKQGPYPKKSRARCALSGERIWYGDPVYMVKLVTYSDGDVFYIHEEKAKEDPAFMRNLACFEQRMYPCSFMFYNDWGYMALFDPDWVRQKREIRQLRSAIAEARFEEERRELQARLDRLDPNQPPLSGEELLERFLDRFRELQTGARPVDLGETKWLWKALGSLLMSELHLLLVERYASLPAELRFALACSDNHAFVRLAEESGLLPDWERIHTLMCKGRLCLADMLTFAEWGRAHPDRLKLLWSTHTLFGILGFSAGGSIGFGEMLENGHAGYLLFLFTAHPELAPMLSAFDPANPYYGKGQAADQELRSLVESYCYQLVYIYRAGVFAALLAGDPDEARKWVALMRENAGYYFHGSPNGFINATEKMAEQYIRKHLK